MHRSRYERMYREESLPLSMASKQIRGSKWNFCFLFVLMVLLCLGMGQMFLFYHVSNSSSVDLQQKLDECTSLLTSYSTKSILDTRSYDLRDVLLLPSSTSDEMTLQAFQSHWQSNHVLYSKCGVTTNRQPISSHTASSSICDYVIISSWAPRPCGIATHSGMLYDALRRVCPLKSRIDVIAVTTSDQPTDAPIVKTLTYDSEEEYQSVAEFITARQYATVIFAYEFGLYKDESVLCMLRHITRSRILTIFHTVADNLPLQKQALTEQVCFWLVIMLVMCARCCYCHIIRLLWLRQWNARCRDCITHRIGLSIVPWHITTIVSFLWYLMECPAKTRGMAQPAYLQLLYPMVCYIREKALKMSSEHFLSSSHSIRTFSIIFWALLILREKELPNTMSKIHSAL